MSLSEKRKELITWLGITPLYEPFRARELLKKVEKQDKKFIQEAQKELKEEFWVNEVIIARIDKIFKKKFGDLAK